MAACSKREHVRAISDGVSACRRLYLHLQQRRLKSARIRWTTIAINTNTRRHGGLSYRVPSQVPTGTWSRSVSLQGRKPSPQHSRSSLSGPQLRLRRRPSEPSMSPVQSARLTGAVCVSVSSTPESRPRSPRRVVDHFLLIMLIEKEYRRDEIQILEKHLWGRSGPSLRSVLWRGINEKIFLTTS
jgi:hypothetical protein